jgi:hypothetical protein
MGKLVIFRRCATLEEALIVSALLKDGGFYNSIGEYHVASVQWDALAAYGGVTIWIPEADLMEAGHYLLEMRASSAQRLIEALGPIDNGQLKMRWGRAWSMLTIYSGFGFVLLAPLILIVMLLPIDLSTNLAPYRAYDYYTPDVATRNSDTGWRLPIWNPEGFLLIITLVIFLILDITGIKDRERMSEHAD